MKRSAFRSFAAVGPRVGVLDAGLVFLYFTKDTEMNGPGCEFEWRPHLLKVHDHVGVPEVVPGVASIFVSIEAMQRQASSPG